MSSITTQLSDLLVRGGWVMYPLLALSVISVALILERCWFWFSIHRPAKKRKFHRMTDSFRKGDAESLRAMSADDQTPYGRLAWALLTHGASDAVAIEAVEEQRPTMERFMVMFSTIITAAPMLGILGTVTGIIKSFNLLGSQSQLTDPGAVSAGIAEALLTTAFGLVVALVTLFPYMFFRGQVDRALGRMESLVAAAQQSQRAMAQPTIPSIEEKPAAGAAAAQHREASEPPRRAMPMESGPAR